MSTMYKELENYYFLEYAAGEVVDGCRKGTEARFINHSCDPNCHIEKWYSCHQNIQDSLYMIGTLMGNFTLVYFHLMTFKLNQKSPTITDLNLLVNVKSVFVEVIIVEG